MVEKVFKTHKYSRVDLMDICRELERIVDSLYARVSARKASLEEQNLHDELRDVLHDYHEILKEFCPDYNIYHGDEYADRPFWSETRPDGSCGCDNFPECQPERD